MNHKSAVDIFINHDRGSATFAELAEFVDEVRSRHPDKKDSDILMEMDDSLSDHESVNYFVNNSI